MKRKKKGTKVKDVQRIQMNDYLTKVVNENDVCDSFDECNQPIYAKIPKI